MEAKNASLGCCGHDCTRCVTYLATAHDDDKLRCQSQQFYRDTFGVDLPTDAFHCLGCRSGDVFVLCQNCPFTACAAQHGITHCSDCGEYPCPMLRDYQANYVNRCHQMPPDQPIS